MVVKSAVQQPFTVFTITLYNRSFPCNFSLHLILGTSEESNSMQMLGYSNLANLVSNSRVSYAGQTTTATAYSIYPLTPTSAACTRSIVVLPNPSFA
jgi:hypothetical protein